MSKRAQLPSPSGVSAKIWGELWQESARLQRIGLVECMRERQSHPAGAKVSLLQQEIVGLGFDFSCNLLSHKAWALLHQLAKQRKVQQFWNQVATEQVVNLSEGRPASHMRWRDAAGGFPDGFDRPRFSTVLNIGIGGSELGPSLLKEGSLGENEADAQYIALSTPDKDQLVAALSRVNLNATGVVIASKSFTTAETLLIAGFVREYFVAAGIADWRPHFFAVTAATDKAREWGVSDSHIFDMGINTGGRYSIASPISLAVVLTCGDEPLKKLRKGMRAVDEAIALDPVGNPILKHALIWYWYRVFCGLQSVAVVPYVLNWRLLTPYLQQLVMESLGKSHTQTGQPVKTPVGCVVIGEAGTNAQHSFMQYLQQGTTAVPVDLLTPIPALSLDSATSLDPADAIAGFAFENAVAQHETLAFGGEAGADHLRSPGGRPSNLFVLPDARVETLGKVVAFYEHSVIYQAALYDINPFDQWGVEAGKRAARELGGRFPGVTLQVALEFLRDRVTGRFGA